MIRFVHCMMRRSDVDETEFRRFWNSPEFDALNQRLATLIEPIQARRTLVLNIDENQKLMHERGGAAPFDAMLELWFDNGRALQRFNADPGYQALMAEMEALQARFVDFSRSVRFFTEWGD
ncbi:MAG: EthD domain-containing protein [Thiobacillaceae bacterium]|jgi:hypothetical protein|nr:EthD domain-containing protein [Thiobacillaceae bacterium]